MLRLDLRGLRGTVALINNSSCLQRSGMAGGSWRNPLAGEKFRECVLGLRAAHHLRGVVMLCCPSGLEALALLFEQQRLHPSDGTAVVAGDHFRDLHRLHAELSFGNEMIEKANAVGFLGLDDASREQKLLGLRPANLAAERPSGIDPPVGCSEETEP